MGVRVAEAYSHVNGCAYSGKWDIIMYGCRIAGDIDVWVSIICAGI